MRVGDPFRAVAWTTLAGAGFFAPAARGQDVPASQPEAAVPASQPAGQAGPTRGPLHLNIADLYLEIESDYQFRRVRSKTPYTTSSSQENRDFRLDELMGIAFTGDIVDPNLFEYRAALDFGLSQMRDKEKFDGLRQNSDSQGFLLHYDVAVDALKSKPVSVHAYGRQEEARVPRRFLPSLHEVQTEAGASVLALTGPVTTEIGYSFNDVDRTHNRYGEDNEEMTTNRFYADSKWQISDRHMLHLSYDHELETDDYQGSAWRFHSRRDELRLEHELGFGEGNRLDTFLRYDEESGTLGRDEIEITPRLTLQHTDKLKSIYRYSFYEYRQQALDVQQNKVDAQALYQATKDLRLSAEGYGLLENVNKDIESHEFGADGEATFHRTSSLGEFSTDLNLGYDQSRTTGDAGRRYVRNEAHAMVAVVPIFLREPGVMVQTIIAHNDRYTRIYIIGVDYNVIMIGDRAFIQRVPWGRIAEGEIVFFDYQYKVSARSAVDSYRVDFRIEHTFPFGLTPYYYWESRYQDLNYRSIGTPINEDRQDRHRFGARYGKQLWTVTGEYEIFDDSIEPYDAFHFTGQASLLRQPAHSLDANGEVSRYFFHGGYDRRRVWFLDLNLKDRFDISSFLSFNSGAELRHEDDDVLGKTEGIDLECGLKYVRGYLTVELNLEYDLLNVVKNRENGFGLFLNMRRDLSHLLPERREEMR